MRPLRWSSAVALLVAVLTVSTFGAAPPAQMHPGQPLAPSATKAPSDAGGGAAWPTYMDNVGRTAANHLERTLAPTTVAALTPLWSIPSNGSDFSAPIVVHGTVYFGSWNGTEEAVNATTGTVLWSQFLGVDTACGGYSPMGISSTPAYANGTIYLGGGDGYWYALNASSGQVLWRMLPGSETDGYYAWASALVYDGSLYVGTSSCFDNPLVPAGLLRVATSDGAVLAQFNSTPVGGTGESVWTSPALDPTNHTVWITTGNENPPGYPLYANAVIALNATTLNVSGSWQVPNVAGEDSDFGSTPTLFHTAAGVPMIVASNKNGVAYALNRSNVSAGGDWGPSWNLSTGGGFSGAAFDGETLYLGGGSSVEAVVPANGSVLWTAPLLGGGPLLGSLAWANGVLYAGGGDEVEAIDAGNGTVLWNATLAPGQQTVTEPVVVGGELFVASGNYAGLGYLTAYGLAGTSLFHLTFNASGVPAGKSWSASVGGVTRTSTDATISFLEANGSLPYLLRGPRGMVVGGLPPVGNVTVAGANVSEALTLSHGRTVGVAFAERGLVHHTGWCIRLAGWSGCSLHGRISLGNLTPATYSYGIGPVAGYTLSARLGRSPVPASGELVVQRPTTFHLRFSEVTYPVVFQEAGLAAGVRWSVRVTDLAGGSHRAVHGSARAPDPITLDLPNGSYSYLVRAPRHYAGGGTGGLTVDGTGSAVNLSFSPALHRVGTSPLAPDPGGPSPSLVASARRR